MSDSDKFDTSQSFELSTWLSLWSYEKTHAFAYGAFYAGLAAALASAYVLSVGAGIFMWAIGIRTSPHRETKSGDRKADDSDGQSADEKSSGLSMQILSEIRHKPHYFFMGSVVGDRIGYLIHYYLYGVGPQHYTDAIEMAGTLFGI